MAMKQGDFVWHDLMTTDAAGAEAFYAKVIGWTVTPSHVPGYKILSTGTTPVGGLMELPEPARAAGMGPRWMGYIGVDDVDAKAEALKAAGGAVHRAPADIPGVGRFAVVADPHGAGFQLFKGAGEPPPEAPLGTPGTVGWNELHAGDGETAFAFYSGLFGWTKDQAIPMGPMGTYQLFANGGPAIGGMMTRMPNQPATTWFYYFNVDAIDAAVSRATGSGGKVVHGASEVPGGQWVVHCVDPQGATFAMVAPGR